MKKKLKSQLVILILKIKKRNYSKEFKIVRVDEIKSQNKNSMSSGPFGSNIKTDNFVSVGVPVIRGGNLSGNRFNEKKFVFVTENKANELKASNAFPGDIVFTHRGTLGQIVMIPKDSKYSKYLISQSQMKLTCDERKVDPYYIYCYFRSPQGQKELLSYANPTGVPALYKPLDSLKRMEVLLFVDPNYQKIISNFIHPIDNQIQILEEINEVLDKINETVFKSWFVDFNGQKELVDSEIGEIPKGWKIGTLDEICDITMGQSPPGESYNQDGIGTPFYQGVKDFGFMFPTKRVFCTKPKRFAKKHDVLFSVRAPVGDLNFATEKCCIGRGLAALRLKKNSGPYLYYLLKNEKPIWEIFDAEGTVFGATTKDDIYNLQLIKSPPELIKKFNIFSEKIYNKIWNNTERILNLEEIRNFFFRYVFGGKSQFE